MRHDIYTFHVQFESRVIQLSTHTVASSSNVTLDYTYPYVSYTYIYGSRSRLMLYCLYPKPSMVTQKPSASIWAHTRGYRSRIHASTSPCFSILVVVLYQLPSLLLS
jgi:hypothetical protein